jgi:hypothetical protein
MPNFHFCDLYRLTMGMTTMDLGSSVEHVNSEMWYLVCSHFLLHWVVHNASTDYHSYVSFCPGPRYVVTDGPMFGVLL